MKVVAKSVFKVTHKCSLITPEKGFVTLKTPRASAMTLFSDISAYRLSTFYSILTLSSRS